MFNEQETIYRTYQALDFYFECHGAIRLYIKTMKQIQNENGEWVDDGYIYLRQLDQIITNDIFIDPETLKIVEKDTEGAVPAFDYVYSKLSPILKPMAEGFVAVNQLI